MSCTPCWLRSFWRVRVSRGLHGAANPTDLVTSFLSWSVQRGASFPNNPMTIRWGAGAVGDLTSKKILSVTSAVAVVLEAASTTLGANSVDATGRKENPTSDRSNCRRSKPASSSALAGTAKSGASLRSVLSFKRPLRTLPLDWLQVSGEKAEAHAHSKKKTTKAFDMVKWRKHEI